MENSFFFFFNYEERLINFSLIKGFFLKKEKKRKKDGLRRMDWKTIKHPNYGHDSGEQQAREKRAFTLKTLAFQETYTCRSKFLTPHQVPTRILDPLFFFNRSIFSPEASTVFWMCTLSNSWVEIIMAPGRVQRDLIGPLLAANFIVYLIVLGLAGWSLDKYINGEQDHPRKLLLLSLWQFK